MNQVAVKFYERSSLKTEIACILGKDCKSRAQETMLREMKTHLQSPPMLLAFLDWNLEEHQYPLCFSPESPGHPYAV